MGKLPSVIHTRISRRILSLEDNPRPRGARKLSSREEYRLRVGDYRVLYTIDDKNSIITVFAVGHRREVYR
ncbi:MAG: type II toxin-antitoxin system RelE/ParE family toxin [Chloroflexi bacterium]|nr:type II toxin-antitoxin system RelE/ParE family toxin [Chloroflexota bacterium]MBI3040721.1 type II toxin-antitoxin system RelE/ParE family toxin [Chloroflexota bacterium]MBI3931264.1 type II toxin-antitoxin system RelE/ParE family toxin [Chloroflexota bacterium]